MTLLDQYNRELYHYGVKGMKWGVRKEKASLKRLGKEYYKESKRKGHSSLRTLAESDAVSTIYNSENVKRARDSIRKTEKIRDDFYNNSKLLDKYQRKVAKEISEKHGIKYDDALFGLKYDDFDQGDTSTFDRYLKDTGKYDSFHKSLSNAYGQYEKACKEAVDGYLKDNGNMRVKDLEYRYKSGSLRATTVNTTMSKLFDKALNYRQIMDSL